MPHLYPPYMVIAVSTVVVGVRSGPAASCFLQEPLPTHPLSGMINKYGAKVRLHFKQELDQLWIGTKGTMKCWYMYRHHGDSINSDTVLIVSDTMWTSSIRLLLPTYLRT